MKAGASGVCHAIGEDWHGTTRRCQLEDLHDGLHRFDHSWFGTEEEVAAANESPVCGKVWRGHVCYKERHHPHHREHECWCGMTVVEDLKPMRVT